MKFTPRTALGLSLVPLAPFTRAMDARRIREQLAFLDNMAANNFDLKQGVREKLLARLKELEASSPPGVTHAAGRGDLNDRNTVNSEAAAGAEAKT